MTPQQEIDQAITPLLDARARETRLALRGFWAINGFLVYLNFQAIRFQWAQLFN